MQKRTESLLRDLAATVHAMREELFAFKLTLSSTPRLCCKDVMQYYGISKSTLYRGLRSGRIPKPVKITGPRWRQADLEQSLPIRTLKRPVSA